MEQRKIFTTKSTTNKKPIEFEIQGTMTNGQPLEPVVFRCHPDVPGRFVFDQISAHKEGGLAVAAEIIAFIEQCLLNDDERNRFFSLTNSTAVNIKLETLVLIQVWLLETYNNRPLDTSLHWSTGDSPTPTTSPANGQSQASIPWNNPPQSS